MSRLCLGLELIDGGVVDEFDVPANPFADFRYHGIRELLYAEIACADLPRADSFQVIEYFPDLVDRDFVRRKLPARVQPKLAQAILEPRGRCAALGLELLSQRFCNLLVGRSRWSGRNRRSCHFFASCILLLRLARGDTWLGLAGHCGFRGGAFIGSA